MSDKKSYSVTILGNSYRLVSDEDPSHIAEVGAHVDTVMRGIQRAGVTDESRIAVLAAVQIASKTRQLERIIEQYAEKERVLAEQIDQMLSDSSELNSLDGVRPAVDDR